MISSSTTGLDATVLSGGNTNSSGGKLNSFGMIGDGATDRPGTEIESEPDAC